MRIKHEKHSQRGTNQAPPKKPVLQLPAHQSPFRRRVTIILVRGSWPYRIFSCFYHSRPQLPVWRSWPFAQTPAERTPVAPVLYRLTSSLEDDERALVAQC